MGKQGRRPPDGSKGNFAQPIGKRQSPASVKRTRFAQALWSGMSECEAAKVAGFKGASLKVQASKLTRHPEVRAELERLKAAGRQDAARVAEKRRVLEILTDQVEGRHLDYARFDDAGNFTGLDLKRMRDEGRGHMLYGLETSPKGEMRFKFATSQGAVDRLARLLNWNPPEKQHVTHDFADLANMSDADLQAEAKKLGIKP